MDSEKRVEDAASCLRMNLLLNNPFYGNVLYRLCEVKWSTVIDTACTDGRDLFFNREFVSGLTDGQINFVILHEMYHVLLLHRLRFEEGDKDAFVWNVACDAVINYELYSRVAEFSSYGIEVSLLDDCILLKNKDSSVRDLSAYTAEMIYDELVDELSVFSFSCDSDVTCPMGGDGFGDAPSDGFSSTSGMSKEEVKEVKETIRSVIREAISKEWSLCEGGGIRSEMEHQLEKTRIRWDRYLRKFLSERVTDETSWSCPERMYLPHGMIMPGEGATEEWLGEVWFFVDTSGSIREDELCRMLSNAWTICDEYGASMSIALWNTSVYWNQRCIECECVEGSLRSVQTELGGTRVECVYDFIKQERLKAPVFVIFTDGYFEIPVVKRSIARKTIIGTTGNGNRLVSLGKVVSI